MTQNSRFSNKLQLSEVKTTYLGIDTVGKVWETLPQEQKNSDYLQIFKTLTMNAKPATADYIKYFILVYIFYCKL